MCLQAVDIIRIRGDYDPANDQTRKDKDSLSPAGEKKTGQYVKIHKNPNVRGNVS